MKAIWEGKKSWPIIFCLSLVIGVGFLFSANVFGNFAGNFNVFKSASAQVTTIFKIKGWAWSGTTGWISLSCANIAGSCANSNYGLEVNSSSQIISGFAWSSNLGWICFGATCSGNSPDGLQSIAKYSCEDIPGDCSTDGYHPPIIGWAKIVNLGDKGWISLSCKNFAASCTNYGLVLNFEDAILGVKNSTIATDNWIWQYAGGGAGNAYGTGWIQFNTDTEILAPYLQVKGGDAYSRKFTSLLPPPKGRYNAQYLIQSQGNIGRFRTACIGANNSTVDSCRFGTYSALTVPEIKPGQNTSNNPYTFKLGRFDFHNLFNNLRGTKNRYGYEVVKPTVDVTDFNNFLANQLLAPLNNKVVYVDSNITINDTIIKNGNNLTPSGAGTIVVGGNLTINNNINYESAVNLNSNKKLASVVWIVLGDVNIAWNVTDVVGNFVVLGKRDFASCGGGLVSGQIPQTCGRFDTCNPSGNSCKDNQLSLTGSVFARQFFLNRTYVDSVSKEPAELFTADGRMQLNPPPGFADFAKGLPTFSRQ